MASDHFPSYDKINNQSLFGLLNLHTEAANTDDTSRRETTTENSARPAVVEYTYFSFRTGQVRVKAPLDFGVRFMHEPSFSFGSAVKKHPDPTHWHDPRGSTGIRSWIRDKNGFWTGANIWLRVDIEAILAASGAEPPEVHVLHYLRFHGVAFKNVPTSQLENTTARTGDV